MSKLYSRAFVSGEVVLWIVNAHRFEFTKDEMEGMLRAVRTTGLFAHVQNERPALHGQFLAIQETLDEEIESDELEYLLEQALIHEATKL